MPLSTRLTGATRLTSERMIPFNVYIGDIPLFGSMDPKVSFDPIKWIHLRPREPLIERYGTAIVVPFTCL